jgi:hypothetical protein
MTRLLGGRHGSLRPVSLAKRLMRTPHRRGLVSWERTDPDAQVLMVTNTCPHSEHPTHGRGRATASAACSPRNCS